MDRPSIWPESRQERLSRLYRRRYTKRLRELVGSRKIAMEGEWRIGPGKIWHSAYEAGRSTEATVDFYQYGRYWRATASCQRGAHWFSADQKPDIHLVLVSLYSGRPGEPVHIPDAATAAKVMGDLLREYRRQAGQEI